MICRYLELQFVDYTNVLWIEDIGIADFRHKLRTAEKYSSKVLIEADCTGDGFPERSIAVKYRT